MPPVSRRDDHRVDVVAFQDFRHVVVRSAIGVPVMPIGLDFDRVTPHLLGIGIRNELAVLLPEKSVEDLLTPSPNPDATKNNTLAWSDPSISTERRGGNDGGDPHGGKGRFFDEGTAGVLSVHFVCHSGKSPVLTSSQFALRLFRLHGTLSIMESIGPLVRIQVATIALNTSKKPMNGLDA